MFHARFTFAPLGLQKIQFILRVGSNLPSLWLCRALCQTIIFCIAICRRPLQMIDMLNRTSGARINRQAHSWVPSQPPSSSGGEWNNICLLHQGLVYPLPTCVSCVIARGNQFQGTSHPFSAAWPVVWQLGLMHFLLCNLVSFINSKAEKLQAVIEGLWWNTFGDILAMFASKCISTILQTCKRRNR